MTKIIIGFIMLIILGISVFYISSIDLEEILNPTLNGGCETNEQCYYYYGAVCKIYNIKDKNCVREGYTGKGFLGLTDFNNEYYVCEDYGRIALSCEEYYTYEEFERLVSEGSHKTGVKK